MIPKWFLRSRVWFVNMFMDEYLTREPMNFMLGLVIMHVPLYIWGLHVNREAEIQSSHVNYMVEYGPRRNRLAHSLIFEEFDMHLDAWKAMEKAQPN